jgi:hypothetical protein
MNQGTNYYYDQLVSHVRIILTCRDTKREQDSYASSIDLSITYSTIKR